ncbi:hypothetical protein [Streptomyces sp. NPDC086519]|uniref:hypothetical protein n=1 Tax=Streptomyces sp. NPDC086519 TaxID=3154863 RepID=UPI003433B945
MIALPRLGVPVPDGIALRIARQLPDHIQQAIGEAAEAGRLLTCRVHAVSPFDVRMEAGGHLHQRLARANKQLAAHDPRLTHGWADMPGRR